MAKLKDMVVCEFCQKLQALKAVQISLIMHRGVLRNEVICSECLKARLEGKTP